MARTADDHATVDTLKQDIAALKDDVASLVAGYKAKGEDEARFRIAEAKRAAGDMADRGRYKASEYAERGRYAAERSHDSLGDFVGERPITSLAIAAGAGAVLASLIKATR